METIKRIESDIKNKLIQTSELKQIIYKSITNKTKQNHNINIFVLITSLSSNSLLVNILKQITGEGQPNNTDQTVTIGLTILSLIITIASTYQLIINTPKTIQEHQDQLRSIISIEDLMISIQRNIELKKYEESESLYRNLQQMLSVINPGLAQMSIKTIVTNRENPDRQIESNNQ